MEHRLENLTITDLLWFSVSTLLKMIRFISDKTLEWKFCPSLSACSCPIICKETQRDGGTIKRTRTCHKILRVYCKGKKNHSICVLDLYILKIYTQNHYLFMGWW